jgi:hypothetical protein
MALGAQRAQLVWLFARQTAACAAIGKCAPLSNVLSHEQCAGWLASESRYFAAWSGGAEIATLFVVRAEGAATSRSDTYRARDPCLI